MKYYFRLTTETLYFTESTTSCSIHFNNLFKQLTMESRQLTNKQLTNKQLTVKLNNRSTQRASSNTRRQLTNKQSNSESNSECSSESAQQILTACPPEHSTLALIY